MKKIPPKRDFCQGRGLQRSVYFVDPAVDPYPIALILSVLLWLESGVFGSDEDSVFDF